MRLAGAALCTAGLAFIGFGTIGSPGMLGGHLAAANPASDDDGTYTCPSGNNACLNGAQQGTTALAFTHDSSVCDERHGDGTDVWHFVLPTDSDAFVSFTGVFDDLTGTDTNVTNTNTASVPNIVFGHSGKFAFVSAPAGWELDNAYGVASVGTDTTSAVTFQLSGTCPFDGTTSTTTTTDTVPTTVVSSTTTTTTQSTTTTATKSTTATVTTTKSTTVSVPTTATATATTTVSTTATDTVPTTVTDAVPTTVTHSTTVTVPATVTVPTTVLAPTTVSVPTTVTVTAGSPVSPTSSSSSSTPAARVLPATTSTPATGADVEFGIGLVLLVTGGGLLAGATRIARRKRS